MKREVIVFAEGQTEVKFIGEVVAPALRHLQVFVKAETLPTSKSSSGGGVNFDRLKFYALKKLREKSNTILSTFLDLYQLDTSFPSFDEALKKQDVHVRTTYLEDALHSAIIECVQCSPSRFVPHIQPYEFEGLLFSNITALCEIEPAWGKYHNSLATMRAEFPTPEHVNGNYETRPSLRLQNLLQPKYKKKLHGTRAAKNISLSTIEAECAHFHRWMEKLRALATV